MMVILDKCTKYEWISKNFMTAFSFIVINTLILLCMTNIYYLSVYTKIKVIELIKRPVQCECYFNKSLNQNRT